MKKTILSKLIPAVVLTAVVMMGICEAVSDDIASGMVRLHIIANSDSDFDQQVKLAVRDRLIRLSENLTGGADMNLAVAEQYKTQLENEANAVLRENGCAYSCSIETGNFHFPTKSYENITLPEGDYNAVRVVLGAGSGQNWWCVMYPPLCFTESAKGAVSDENQKKLSGMMGNLEYQMISDESITIKPAFKAVEIWQRMKQTVSKSLRIENKKLLSFD